MESFTDAWMNVPLGVLLDHLNDVADRLWEESRREVNRPEYELVGSLLKSLERVVGYLGTTKPPQLAPRRSQELPVLGGKQRARGRVCFKCRGQIRSTQEMVTICPVWVPGLPVHKSCFESLDEEFGGRQ